MRSQVPWKFRDVFIVILLSYFSPLYLSPIWGLFFKISGLFSNNLSARWIILLYSYNLLSLCLPLFWIWKRYRANIVTLGIRKGRWRTGYLILLGIVVGIACYMVGFVILGRQLKPTHTIIDNFFSLFMSRVTLLGFQIYVLSPITEEVADRGFLYGYLRGQLGIWWGLIIQSVVFTLYHVGTITKGAILPILQIFLLGLVFGVLYETSRSLYPSMICHGVVNFLNTIFEGMVE